jgi:hypothetical protein
MTCIVNGYTTLKPVLTNIGASGATPLADS